MTLEWDGREAQTPGAFLVFSIKYGSAYIALNSDKEGPMLDDFALKATTPEEARKECVERYRAWLTKELEALG